MKTGNSQPFKVQCQIKSRLIHMKREMLSPRYTTRFSDLLVVR
ncbi:DUF4113 domain-containing protein [Salmonella enterica]